VAGVRWAGCGIALVGLAVPCLAQTWTTFYSAYQDGLDALRQGDPALAAKAFRRAIALAPAPGNRVKTYGLNFLNTYHPYLKLAEASLAAGDLAQAQAALKEAAAWGVEPQAQRDALQARLASAQKPAAARVPESQAPVAMQVPAPAPQPQPSPGGLSQPAAAGQTASPQARAIPEPPSAQAGPAKPGPLQAPAKAGPAQASLKAPAAPPDHAPVAPPPAAGQVPPGQGAVPGPSPAAQAGAGGGPAPTPLPQAAARPGSQPSWRLWAGLGALAALGGGAGLALGRSRRPAPPKPQGNPTTPFPMATAGPTHPAPPQAAPERRDPNLERAFGAWVAKRVLGSGGCGTAYYGVHAVTGAPVAIKVPHPHLLQNPEFLARFRREAAMGTVLDHPGIVGILDPGPPEGEPWLVMPFVDGVTLEAYLQQFSPLSIPAAIRLGADVAEAVAYAHTKGIVHRDLKPANIMVCPQGAVVMDLGIARILDSGKNTSVYMGTPTYSAPEAMQNPSVGPPADRYALGILLFEMLTGAPPFQGDNAFKILEAHAFEPLPDLLARRPLVPPRLNRLIQRLCEKKPDERPEDGETLQILRELKGEFPCDPA